jgi:sirohydrochlorin cobaltochelatase
MTPTAAPPATLLLAAAEPGTGPALGRLARRLAARLGHPVEPCRLDGAVAPLAEVAERVVACGASRLVVLPLAMGGAGDLAGPFGGRLGQVLAAVAGRWPALRLHRGAPPGADDLARILGDRAREGLGTLGRRRLPPADVVIVLVGGPGGNPAHNAELARLARLVYEAHRFGEVAHAFVELTAPRVGDVVARWARLGARAVVVVPAVLFAGRTYRAIAAQAQVAARTARLPVAVARPLDPHPALVWTMVRRHLEALLDGGRDGPDAGALPWVDRELFWQLQGPHGHGAGPLHELETRMAAMLPPRYRAPGGQVSPAPMGAVEVQKDAEGRVAWDAMWQGFCELALAGGPPHRGTLLEPVTREEAAADPQGQAAVVAELARGIRMVTGLETLDGPPGWIGVACESEEMAVWLMRAVLVENVMARREGTTLYLPAGPRFSVAGEIKNVITAVAKTHHYWTQHAAARAAAR